MAEQTSRFRFIRSRHIPELTVLQATMSRFSYDRHAHEEYAFGVTLGGRQDFFSGGEFHRSPPGNVILFNPEEGRAKEYIHAHLDADVSLDDISQAAHLSKYHFLRLFRQQFGLTPHQYVINCRINAARGALDAGTTPNEVAFRYGFADLSHFNRRFKRIYGMTPCQYQRNVID